MAKNASNELKFGPDMYFYEFYQNLKDFLEILKIGWILAENAKNAPLGAFSAS